MLIDNTDGSLRFCSTLLTFKDYGETKEVYTDSKSLYDEMIYADQNRYTDYTATNVEPTEEQEARLAEVNAIEGDKSGFIAAVSEFVRSGYCPSTGPELLSSLVEKYKDMTKAYLLEQYAETLSTLKDEKETGGITFQEGYIVQTDVESQSKITALYATVQSGVLSNVSFKFANNQYLTLTASQISTLALLVLAHVQSAYTAETKTLEYLNNLDVTALEAYLDNEGDLSEDETELTAANDLSTLYDSNYETILAAYKAELTSTSAS